jgi:hypothetical protein
MPGGGGDLDGLNKWARPSSELLSVICASLDLPAADYCFVVRERHSWDLHIVVPRDASVRSAHFGKVRCRPALRG